MNTLSNYINLNHHLVKIEGVVVDVFPSHINLVGFEKDGVLTNCLLNSLSKNIQNLYEEGKSKDRYGDVWFYLILIPCKNKEITDEIWNKLNLNNKTNFDIQDSIPMIVQTYNDGGSLKLGQKY